MNLQTEQQQSYYYSHRPSLPQPADAQSAVSSAFQSSASLSSISSMSTSAEQQHFMGGDHPPTFSSAPLPSPSQSRTHYFGSIPTQMPEQQQQPQQQHVPHRPRPSFSQEGGSGIYQGQRGDGAGTPETAPFLKDFSLLAEAAKRAEMACLMRDLGDVEL